ncbi:DUF3566 domain-containing protein [Rhodococcus xishaensis]|uniref:DUF3566 domain-containing protein n=1 Tax=Rhodococcus xishaensis TaxID=2487364 RepID=A0A3S3BII4_9NOCA|nr:DUF3566 domain-containing protein [Rhodococcus xishaensis]RVW02067.1 hypothetical protein EGT50_11635 [Rhodococcus xishaensis]
MSTPQKSGEQDRGDKPDQQSEESVEPQASQRPGDQEADGKPGQQSEESVESQASQRPGDQEADGKPGQQSEESVEVNDGKPVAGPADVEAGPADVEDGPEPKRPQAETSGQPAQPEAKEADGNRLGQPAPGGPAGGPKPPVVPSQPGTNGAAKPPAETRPVVTGTAAPKPPSTPAQPAPAQTGSADTPIVAGAAAPKQPTPAPGGGAETGGRGAAKAEARAAAQMKAAVIDGPTRNIARTDLAKDMPDLSSVKHPAPSRATAPTGSSAPAGVSKPTAAPRTVSAPAEGKKLRATVQVRRIDPWSTLKVSLVISIALFFVWMVAVGLLYLVLDGMGVWDRLNTAFNSIVTDASSGGLVTSGQVFGYSALIGLMNMVLLTALATIGSFIYNLCSDLVGGVQVTLADPD